MEKYFAVHNRFEILSGPYTREQWQKLGTDSEHRYYEFNPKELKQVDMQLIISSI